MSWSLLQPPAHLSPTAALEISQQAPFYLNRSSSKASSLPLWLSFEAETPGKWNTYENLFLACLRTGDDDSAKLCLEKLTERFGASNERIMGLRGMYEEATAENEVALQRILKSYDSTLAEDPTNTPVAKRRIALLRSLSRPVDAIAALVELLDSSPTDAEAWSELSDLYHSQGLYQQAIFSLEEVLLITPNAWNIHARMGELVFQSVFTKGISGGSQRVKSLFESMRWFCRSIELCEDYLRGHYGLKVVTNRLLSMGSLAFESSTGARGSEADGQQPPSQSDVKRLDELATVKLMELVRRGGREKSNVGAYGEAELFAAHELNVADLVMQSLDPSTSLLYLPMGQETET